MRPVERGADMPNYGTSAPPVKRFEKVTNSQDDSEGLGMTASREVFQQAATDSPAVGHFEINRKPVIHKHCDQQEPVLSGTCTRQRPVSDKPTTGPSGHLGWF